MNKPIYKNPHLRFQGKRFNVLDVDLELSTGTITRELVDHPGAVAIIPFLNEQDIVLIRNFRFSIGSFLLELPAGTLEKNEDPKECAFRELEEETGYRAQQMQRLLEFYPTPGFCNEVLSIYVARQLSFFGQKLDQSEQIDIEICSFKNALNMVKNGKIKDGKTISALLYYQTFLNCTEVF